MLLVFCIFLHLHAFDAFHLLCSHDTLLIFWAPPILSLHTFLPHIPSPGVFPSSLSHPFLHFSVYPYIELMPTL